MTLEELRKHKHEIEAIAAKYGVSNIRVFGSVVRGEAGQESDIDLLVTFSMPLGFAAMNPKLELESYFRRSVDVVDERCLDPFIGPHIRAEAVIL